MLFFYCRYCWFKYIKHGAELPYRYGFRAPTYSLLALSFGFQGFDTQNSAVQQSAQHLEWCERMKTVSETENFAKYANHQCAGISSRFYKSLGVSRNNNNNNNNRE